MAWQSGGRTCTLPSKGFYRRNGTEGRHIGGDGAEFDARRFLPYVVMHEFEGLLFSDCERFARGIGREALAPEFQQIRDDFETPEEINDSPLTAPSKRVEALVPGYEKPLLGTLAALEVGLDAIRLACPNFNAWVEYLERWAAG